MSASGSTSSTTAGNSGAAAVAMSTTNNVQTILLQELELTQSDVDDVCSAIVHSILFARVIGLYRPLEGHIQALDISFAQLDDESIRSSVGEQVTRFGVRLQQNHRDMLCVKFFETRKTASWLFQQKDELVCWEQWYIPIRLVSFATPADTSAARMRCARQVTHCLQQVIDVVNNPKHYIPPFSSHEKVPFKFEIAPVKTDSASGGTGLGDIWQMIGGHAMK